MHIVISRIPLKKQISRRRDKNVNRADKMDAKNGHLIHPKKARKEKQRIKAQTRQIEIK